MKKFEGWRTEELQYVATLMASRDMEHADHAGAGFRRSLYAELIREIRNRRVREELGQMSIMVFGKKQEEE